MIKNPSDEQKKILTWFRAGQGNLIVRARAGTGKTTTIVEGVERAPEAKILLAAFNKSIADELKSRIKSEHVQAKTLHGLGLSFVSRAWWGVSIDVDGERKIALARAACEEGTDHKVLRLVAEIHTRVREIQPHKTAADDVLKLMERFDLGPDQEMEVEDGITERWLANRASKAVELAKQKSPLIDFADMIFLPVALRLIRPWFDMVVVDEAQDMTSAQLEIAVGACKRGGRVVIVGDDRQAIYGFRGADSGGLDRLKKLLKAKELGLTTTYRCPKRVVEQANVFVEDFRAAPTAPEGIVEGCSDDHMLTVARPGDFVLSRTNAPLVKVCLQLLRRGVRSCVKGRDVGKGILALVDKQHASSLPELLARVGAWFERESAKAMGIDDDKVAQERLDYVTDQADVVKVLAEDVSSLEELRAKLTTLFAEDGGHSVVCSSVHRAKGLESENVFMLVGTFRAGSLEEDNLSYVAITRSKQRLWRVTGFEPKSRRAADC